jgi:hypothetical protein
MSLLMVTLTGTFQGGSGEPLQGSLDFTPNASLTSAADMIMLPQSPVTATLNSTGSFSVPLYSTDSESLSPAGWAWDVTVDIAGIPPASWSFFLLYSSGATQDISDLSPAVPVTPMAAYLPESGGTLSGTLVLDGSPALTIPAGAADGDVWTSDAHGTGSWQPSAAGSGTVQSVAVESANGLAGTVADATTTPQITLSTTATGVLKGASGAIGAATAGTDYLAPSGSGAALTGITVGQVSGAAPLASPALTGTPTAPTATALADDTQVATTAYTDAAVAVEKGRAETAESASAAAITAETSRAEAAESANASAITTETARAEAAEALLAPLASPALTGSPTAPTKSPLNDSTDIATTAYTDAAVAVETSRAETAEGLLAPKASPALTGTPTAPTASALTDSTQVATTAYTDSAVAVETSRAETAEALKAPLASPALTGTPTAPTASALTDSAQVATTAYTDSAVAAETSRAEAAEALKAPLASPALTGNPTAPTQTASDSSAKIATDAFVQTAAATAQSAAEAASLPLPSGTASSGQVPVATGSGSASAWGTAGLSAGKVLAIARNYAMP